MIKAFSVPARDRLTSVADGRTDEPKGILKLVRAAVLASNAHNAQPWLFHLTDSAIDVFADHQRNIGTVDPFLREMYISVGCALENLSLAAEANGYAPTLTLMPNDADPKHAAHFTFVPAQAKSSPLRRNSAPPYQP